MNISEESTSNPVADTTTQRYSDLKLRLLGKDHIYSAVEFYAQMVISSLCVVSNIYFICCILGLKSLRSVRNMLVMWQAVCDIFSIGFFRTFRVLRFQFPEWRLKIYAKWGFAGYAFYQGQLQCVNNCLIDIVNEYSTAFVILFYAIERFILVVTPHKAKTILTKKNYIIIVSVIVTACASLIIAGIIPENRSVVKIGCSQGPISFWGEGKRKLYLDAIIFFFVPAILAFLLYSVIVWKLLLSKKQTKKSDTGGGPKTLSMKEKRNRTLTIAFIISTSAWIVLWSTYYSQEFKKSIRGLERDTTYWAYSMYRLRDLFFSMYSCVNPICFIVINRQFQEPVLNLIKLLPFAKRNNSN